MLNGDVEDGPLETDDEAEGEDPKAPDALTSDSDPDPQYDGDSEMPLQARATSLPIVRPRPLKPENLIAWLSPGGLGGRTQSLAGSSDAAVHDAEPEDWS